jgi:DnaJ-domain-containing protein 1
MDILSQYRRTDSTAFAMVGIVLLCVDMCKSDGDFTLNQHEDILELLANTEKDREQIEYLIEKAKKDNQSYKVHAEHVYEVLKEHEGLLKMTLASLYKLALTDRILHPKELEMMLNIMEIFKIKPSRSFLIQNRIFEVLRFK